MNKRLNFFIFLTMLSIFIKKYQDKNFKVSYRKYCLKKKHNENRNYNYNISRIYINILY